MLSSLERIERKGRKNRHFSAVSSPCNVRGRREMKRKWAGGRVKRDLLALLLLMMAVGFKCIKSGSHIR